MYAADPEGAANFRRNHHVGFSRIANFDGHFAGDECFVWTMINKVGCRGVKSSRSRCLWNVVLDESKRETEHDWV